MENRAKNILKQNQLSITESRKKILQLFLLQSGALAHSDIEKKTGELIDRVTIYRTLQTFVQKGIIHTIPTSDDTIRYALCKDECTEGHHQDHHVHFICTQCGNTYCLDDVVTPEIHFPIGFTSSHIEVVAEGLCKKCK
jgi:Fur family ferric uptake transcriptional regulator